MAHCCVVYCVNDSRRESDFFEVHGKPLHFHRFPKDEQLKKLWIVAIRRDEGPEFKVKLTVGVSGGCALPVQRIDRFCCCISYLTYIVCNYVLTYVLYIMFEYISFRV